MILLASFLALGAILNQQPSVWVEQRLSDGVVITAPVKLVRSAQKASDPGMARIENWVGVKDMHSFVVGISVLKDPVHSQTSSVFTASTAGLSGDPGTVIVGERDLLLQGWPGLAVTVRDKDGLTMVSRSYRYQDKLVTIGCVYATSSPRTPDVDKFLDSLHFPAMGPLAIAGPALARYPLGSSGMTALFPREPEHHQSQVGAGSARGTTYTFASDYGLRSFEVAYRELPDPLPASLKGDGVFRAESGIVDDVLNSFHAKKGKQKDTLINQDQGIDVEFSIHDQFRGRILVYLHGSRMITLFEFAPSSYEDPKTVDIFLRSIAYKE